MSTYTRIIQRDPVEEVRHFNAKELAQEFFDRMKAYYDSDAESHEECGCKFNWRFVEARTDYFADEMTLTDKQWGEVQMELHDILTKIFGDNPDSSLLRRETKEETKSPLERIEFLLRDIQDEDRTVAERHIWRIIQESK